MIALSKHGLCNSNKTSNLKPTLQAAIPAKAHSIRAIRIVAC